MTRFWILLLGFWVVSISSARGQELVEITVQSSLDQAKQPALEFVPDTVTEAVPLLVLLHTWSGDYKQTGFVEVCAMECAERGWALIHPNFRGPNWTLDACGSDLAVQDVIDAVDWMIAHHKINADRIYLTGVSGGGHMSLLMAGRHPERWAAVSAWVGISDLSAWHSETKTARRNYFEHMEKALGGAPGTNTKIDEDYAHRSPLTWLPRAKGLPIDINAGIHDGHTGSVPISQSLLAFNSLAKVNGSADLLLSPEAIAEMTSQEKIPEQFKYVEQQEDRQHPVLFRRVAGPARVTIFEGGHEGDLPTAIEWLATHTRTSTE